MTAKTYINTGCMVGQSRSCNEPATHLIAVVVVVETAVWNVCDQIIADHPMWIGDDGRPLNYLPEREARIADFVREVADVSAQALAPVLAAAVRDAEQRALREAADEIGWRGDRSPRAWLRDRADRVAEPQHEQEDEA